MSILVSTEQFEFLSDRYTGSMKMEDAIEEYEKLPVFNINENINEHPAVVSGRVIYNDDVQQIVRLMTQFKLTEVFQAMKINLEDPNVEELIKYGNIGTPGRIAKMWVGANNKDDRELLSGRWSTKPRLARFPNTSDKKIPITKRVDMTAVCSHHAAPFSTTFRDDSYALVSYIPNEYVLGISKLQRVVDWISQRGWLQEDLTKEIYDTIKEVAETDSIYVRLVNVTHTCESLRGAKSKDGAFTSEYYDGEFNNKETRDGIGK